MNRDICKTWSSKISRKKQKKIKKYRSNHRKFERKSSKIPSWSPRKSFKILSWSPLGAAWAPLGPMPWKPPLFALRMLGFSDAWLKKVLWWRLEGLVNILGHLGGHFVYFGAPFGLILVVLGRFLASIWLSWDVLGRLGTPFSPKLAQVGPR